MPTAKPKTAYIEGHQYEIACDDLEFDLNKPRKYFDREAHKGLIDVVKNPCFPLYISFRVDQDGKLILVNGELRLRAVKEAGLKTVPATFVVDKTVEIALMENLLRKTDTPVEFDESLKAFMEEHEYTEDELNEIIGEALCNITRPAVNPKPRVLKGKRKTWQEKFINKYDDLSTFVSEINLDLIDLDERKNIISRIQKLQKTTNKVISQIMAAPVPPVEDKKTTKASKKKTADPSN